MTDGLKDAHREAIVAVIAANDRVERAVLFGSRATGTNTVASDIDIALFGNRLTLTDQARLAAALEEIPMAQSVDLVLYDSIRNQTLQDHIRRQGVEWPLRTRREVAATFREVSEFTIGGGWGRDTEFDDSVPVRVIRGTDFDRIRNGEFSGVPARYEQSSKVQRRMLKPGDILLEISGGSRTSNQSTGRSCFVTDRALAQLGKKVIPASFCRLVRVDQAVIDPRLAYYALQEMYVSGRAALYEQQSTGISNFQFEYFLDSEVFRLPPLSEQRAIAHILGTLDDKIELNRRMNATLEAMARALFKSWFVDFDPVRAKMEGRDTGLPKEIADLFPDRLVDSELGEIPERWDVATLGDHVVNFDSKRIPVSGAVRAERSGPYPYHGAAGVLDHVDDYIFDGVFLLIGEDGSVMRENGLAVTQYVYGKFWVNNHAHVLQGAGPVSTEQAYLHFSFEPVAPLVTGAVQPKLSQSRMKCVPFLFAGDDICRAFAEIVQPWFAQLRSRTEETRILAEMRDELLPILVSGRLQVSIEDAPRLDARHPRRATSEGAA